ncbi:GNAT family N-acetyltransferase [Loigolactobacillus jiayinensis]|uniref:GNAT family N-acetyltransferase n=1 Tax=Loigolactobacillus jiayinensis TaxID=2486016 RepID=A0ABW1RBN4_9LACO|nr:GNAT family N-acetyltransferase [Loigolactobacillus jiayinensis]
MKVRHTTDLNNPIYKDALNIRKTVFVEEQQVALDLEIEDEDKTIHFVGYVDNQPVTTARLLPETGGYHVQRVATLKEYRGHNYGHELLTALEDYARQQKRLTLTLGGQDHALGFYEQLGYHKTDRPGFLDAGIPHHEMRKELA